MVTLVVIIILIALMFDFYNGMNDAANSIATVVSTQVLKPWQAVIWAAFFNFVAAFGGYIPFLSGVLGLHVANTIGKGVVNPAYVDQWLVLATLIGAIVWSAYCTHSGIPISISHSLVGGFAGAALVKAGIGALVLKGIIKTAIFIFIAPILGLILGLLLMIIVYWLFQRQPPRRIDKYFRKLQLISAASYSLGHGTNDAQKTMGIIAVLLFTTPGTFYYGKPFEVPFWVVITCHFMIAMGTMAGGWFVIKTLGQRITKLKPVHGFCAETGGAITLFIASAFGIPVSTTHTITGAVMGVGTTHRISAVRWGVARSIVLAWILTIPVSAGIAAIIYAVLTLFK
ncbi:MAG: inorganic phosphate transporter [bacterium]|nr:inorganic phosphate transporter [bacterium]